jgi:hypothetical protein
VPRCIALSTKLHYNCLLQVCIQQPWRSGHRGGGKQKAWRKKRKYDSVFSLLLRLLPLRFLQDHRNDNLECTGVTMICCLHQAVPSRFQVVETSETEEWVLGARNPDVGTKSRRSQKHLPPTSASRAMRRSRSAWQRAVMSLRPCSRCRTRRRS